MSGNKLSTTVIGSFDDIGEQPGDLIKRMRSGQFENHSAVQTQLGFFTPIDLAAALVTEA